MARGIEGNEISTPRARNPATSANKSSTGKNQQTILGFFKKQAPTPSSNGPATSSQDSAASEEKAIPSRALKGASFQQNSSSTLTPAPSSDGPEPASSPPARLDLQKSSVPEAQNGLPSPVSPESEFAADSGTREDNFANASSSPSRRAKKSVNYAETDSGEDEQVFKPVSKNSTRHSRANKRRKIIEDDSDDDFAANVDAEPSEVSDVDTENFIVSDDEDETERPSKTSNKRKRQNAPTKEIVKPSVLASSPPKLREESSEDVEIPQTSTTSRWTFDPKNEAAPRLYTEQPKCSPIKMQHKKKKAHMTEPEKRYPWLANIMDADKHPPSHPDYDPRTIYVPPLAWSNFSPFEKQYWEIKQKFWNTIVFFKKGKFYELYENDATIGNQLFDLKLTDRVNMRMVGVPEASLDYWAAQFVGYGFKIARVDQMESALAKEMRERGETAPAKGKGKEAQVIRRELASVLTAGTLVDGGMLQGDLSTYCVAIKESWEEDHPVFGIAFVDTATAHFQVAQFEDDPDFTKFETFVAQIRPGELLLERSCLSARALRILKGNTSPTTIWNYLKPAKEFWTADMTIKDLEVTEYFASKTDEDEKDHWPTVLNDIKSQEFAMSAFGALTWYLRTLKLDKDLISLGNFSWYDPIKRAETLILDGQSLINLEIFANTYDGSSDGTLFKMLNRCVTPFGKRMLQKWLCHPLADSRKINARLDAVDALNADSTVKERFNASLTKMPDLERLISRVHAGRCKAIDFVRVLEGFEQIEYTMSLLKSFGDGEGVIGRLLSQMPDLATSLKPWEDAFDRNLARDNNILVPQPGVEADFDQSAGAIEDCETKLKDHLQQVRKDLKSSAICYRDIGKEIYQLEIPIKVKDVPRSWDQMSSTVAVKRYWNPELRKLVRQLQEARETHAQIVSQVSGRFYARFDEEFQTWQKAVELTAQLDCLISLAKASQSLGSPSCRPTFVDDARSVLSFRDLRHPTMLHTVSDFIPNDIELGGGFPNINLLTGANAAGKSTVLRMTCVAVILAQLGCYVPCAEATISPVDRIMSRLGANDNIMQQQSTFFVELAETKKMLCDATPRSLVILDELGRGTSSQDGLAVAEAVLHHVAGTVGCVGFFATHYHSLAHEFSSHPEVSPKRMKIDVDDEEKRVTFLYKLEDGVTEGSFGMHCANMCGISRSVIDRAEEAANLWEHSGRAVEHIEKARGEGKLSLGLLSDLSWILKEKDERLDNGVDPINERALDVLAMAVQAL